MDMFLSIKSFTTALNRMYSVFIFLHNFNLLHLHYRSRSQLKLVSLMVHTHLHLENETNTFVVISGLQSGLTYEFMVRVYTLYKLKYYDVNLLGTCPHKCWIWS